MYIYATHHQSIVYNSICIELHEDKNV